MMSDDSTQQNFQQPTRASSPILVGRERELGLLLQVATNPPAVAFVAGEAGFGKTRLASELVAHPALEDRKSLVGHSHWIEEPFPLGPLVEALRGIVGLGESTSLSRIVGSLRPLLPELEAQLPPQPALLNDPRAERHRAFRALRELLGAAGPTVCVLEDLQWADEGTWEFLTFLMTQPPPGLALVLTYRVEDLEASSPLFALASRSLRDALTRTISLTALSRQQTLRMIQAILGGGTISEGLAASVYRWTAGNPFAVEEVIRLLQERDQLAHRSHGWTTSEGHRLEVPQPLRCSILQRVSGLGADARLTVEAAAVLSVDAGEDLLRRVAGLSPARARGGLSQALSAFVIQETNDGLYRLRHALAVEAVHGAIPAPQRRWMHLSAARALEADSDARPLAQIARHFKEAGRRGLWLRYAEAAADVASSTGEDRRAARILEEALTAPELPRAAKTRMALKLGDAALFGRVPAHATRILRRIVGDGSLTRGLRGEIRFSLARLLLLAGDPSSYGEFAQAAEELKRRPGLAARAMAMLAEAGPVSGQSYDQLTWLQRACDAAARQDDSGITTRVLGTRADVLLDLGDPAGWQAVEELPWETRSREQRLDLVRASKYLAQAALCLGHHLRAGALLDQAEQIRVELDHARFATGLATVRTSLQWSTGQWEGLEERAQRLMEATAEGPLLLASNQLTLGWLLLARGQVDDAEQKFAAVLKVVQKSRTLPVLAAVTTGLARIQLAHGAPQKARELAMGGLEEIRARDLWACTSGVAPVAVDALLACREQAEAENLVRALGRGLRGRDAPASSAALALCRGAVAEADARPDAARRWFARSDSYWRRLPFPYEAARARERRGRCLLRTENAEGGRLLAAALAEFEALGAAWDAARVRAQLRAHQITPPPRSGRRGYGIDLSPREAEVARLAATGWTNREIARTLYLSPRTVENHVSSALRKLGATSRRAIAEKL